MSLLIDDLWGEAGRGSIKQQRRRFIAIKVFFKKRHELHFNSDSGVFLDPREIGSNSGVHGGVADVATTRRAERDDTNNSLFTVLFDGQWTTAVTLQSHRYIKNALLLTPSNISDP